MVDRLTAVRDRLGPLFALLGASHLALGAVMAAFPKFFFEEVGPYGTRNDHYTRDLSTFYLALGAVTLVAWKRPSWRVPVLVFSLAQYALHAVNHLIDVGDANPEELGPVNLISLVLVGALLAYMLRTTLREKAAS